MPSFSQLSNDNLSTADISLQKVGRELIKHIDYSVVFGERTPELQFELYKKGRTEVDGEWIITDKSKVVTYKDGYKKLSKHNYSPAQAIDIIPYPSRYSDVNKLKELGRMFMIVASMMYDRGEIEKEIEWGGNWKTFKDYPHLQTKS